MAMYKFQGRKIEFPSEEESSPSANLEVFLRVKPSEAESQAYTVSHSEVSVSLKVPRDHCMRFKFSHIYNSESTQKDIWCAAGKKAVNELLRSRSSTIFCHGTSSSGKTYTLRGPPHDPGLVPRAMEAIFKSINESLSSDPLSFYPIQSSGMVETTTEVEEEIKEIKRNINQILEKEKGAFGNYKEISENIQDSEGVGINWASSTQFAVWVSYLEVYNECLRDLLCPPGYEKHLILSSDDGGTYVKSLKYLNVKSPSEAYDIFCYGSNRLKTSSTELNDRSSRSHSIFTIKLVQRDGRNLQVSSLTLCDLAGAENVKKSKAENLALQETRFINLSLLTLNKCFRILRENQFRINQQMVPFRESKLTRILQRAFNGQEGVKMIAHIDTSERVIPETLNVLECAALSQKIVVRRERFDTRRLRMSRFSHSAPATNQIMKAEAVKLKVDELTAKVKELEDQRETYELEVRMQLGEEFRRMVETLHSSYRAKLDEMNISRRRKSIPPKRRRLSSDESPESLEAAIKQLTAENSLLKEELQDKSSHLSDLLKELSHTKALLTNTKMAKFLAIKQLDSLREILKRMGSGDESAASTYENILKQQKLEESLLSAKEDIDDLTTRLSQLEIENDRLQARVIKRDRKIEDLAMELDNLKNQPRSTPNEDEELANSFSYLFLESPRYTTSSELRELSPILPGAEESKLDYEEDFMPMLQGHLKSYIDENEKLKAELARKDQIIFRLRESRAELSPILPETQESNINTDEDLMPSIQGHLQPYILEIGKLREALADKDRQLMELRNTGPPKEKLSSENVSKTSSKKLQAPSYRMRDDSSTSCGPIITRSRRKLYTRTEDNL